MPAEQYEVSEKALTLKQPPAGDFEVQITVAIKPQDNTMLEGLYKSGGNFSTQVGPLRVSWGVGLGFQIMGNCSTASAM